MIIKDFKKTRNFTSLEAICGKYVFHVLATGSKMDIAVFDHSFRKNPLYRFCVCTDFKSNALVLNIGDGVVVSFDNDAFIRCMEDVFDDCPAEDIKTIFDTMFYIE